MAKLKDDPAVQALIAKALADATKAQDKAAKAQTKAVAATIKTVVSARAESIEDKVVRRALKDMGADLLAAVKGV